MVISAALSAMLVASASNTGSIPLACLGTLPFMATFAYLMIFVTGRRPHFTRDLVCLWLNGRAVGPVPPSKQPRHPSRRRRAIPQEN